mmetsp:Transcript_175964/g.564246  ORF Transcript_175964/g.564246 Transcript_175964/m.564246 type:complete len:973 (+) Transcript_175964:88-3006(+)
MTPWRYPSLRACVAQVLLIVSALCRGSIAGSGDFEIDRANAIVTELALAQVHRYRKAGIPSGLLDSLFNVDSVHHHGLMRIRIIDRQIYVKKLRDIRTGTTTTWDDWTERQLHWLEGLLAAVEKEPIRNVDFVVALSDVPYCELYPWGRDAPVFVFAQKAMCGNMLVPDNSLMHDGYRNGVQDSPYSWQRIVNDSSKIPWRVRPKEIVWDGDFDKPSRRGLKHLRDLLSVEDQAAFNESRSTNGAMFHNACAYKMSLNVEGWSYAMRLKNINLCGSVPLWYMPNPESRYEEYWVAALIENVHYIGIRGSDAGLAREDLKAALKLKDAELETIAHQASKLVSNLLHPNMVMRYLARLLNFYSLTLDFDVAEQHNIDPTGFTLLSRGALEGVRAHAYALSVPVFNFYYPSDIDLRAVVPPEIHTLDLHHVPCWGTVHRLLQCCGAYFHFYNRKFGDFNPEIGRGTLHEFCHKPGVDAEAVRERCCQASLDGIVTIFRNSMGRFARSELMMAMDRSIFALPLKVDESIQVLSLLRSLAVQEALRVAKLTPDTYPSANAELALAWLYTEAFELCTHLQGIWLQRTMTPWGLPLFQLLQAERERTKLSVAPTLYRSPTRTWKHEATDVMLVLGRGQNTLPLKSMLANRQCSLRLHVLCPASDIYACSWVNELVESRSILDVAVHQYHPAAAAAEVCELVLGMCDVTFARFVPELWLKDITTLVVLDLSMEEVGPLVLGDICELHHTGVGADGRPRPALVAAAKYEEHLRWMLEMWSPAVLVMNLGMQLHNMERMAGVFHRQPDIHEHLQGVVGQWCDGPASWQFAHLWLLYLNIHTPDLMLTLPTSWYFVPYEPWLFDLDWDTLLTLPVFSVKWKSIFQMREYPGFDGRELRISCPPTSIHLPFALLTVDGVLGSNDTVVGRIPDDVYTWRGVDNCNAPVSLLGLRWARARPPRRYPVGEVSEAQWVRDLVKKYEQL